MKYKLKSLAILAMGLLLGAFNSSCSLVNQKLDPNVYYKRDVRMTINGVDFEGIAVPKKADSYKIKIRSRGVIDMITIRSCHREVSFEEPSKGWFSSGKNFEFEYKPIKGIEDGRGCYADVGLYEKEKGRHGWALIDFESPEETIRAEIKCNGEKRAVGPVSICQAHSNTIQKIQFDHKVKVSPDNEKCNIMKSEDEMGFKYVIPSGECIFYFCDKLGYCHRHTTLGYDGLLVRKVGE